MGAVHRQDDLRSCSATTVVNNQSTVFVNGKLWAIKDSINSHGNGQLINSGSTVTINGLPVIIQNDNAKPDNLCPKPGGNHCNPVAVGHSDNVFCY